jgi:hypothetical protein
MIVLAFSYLKLDKSSRKLNTTLSDDDCSVLVDDCDHDRFIFPRNRKNSKACQAVRSRAGLLPFESMRPSPFRLLQKIEKHPIERASQSKYLVLKTTVSYKSVVYFSQRHKPLLLFLTISPRFSPSCSVNEHAQENQQKIKYNLFKINKNQSIDQLAKKSGGKKFV